jgi:hypothetical protein
LGRREEAAVFRALGAAVLNTAVLAGCGAGSGPSDPTTTRRPGTTAQPPESSTSLLDAPSVGVDEVFGALAGQGLAVTDRRSNDGMCDEMACTRWETSEEVTVAEWTSAADAAKWRDASPAGTVIIIGDRTTVYFHSGGTTPAYERAKFDAAIETLN